MEHSQSDCYPRISFEKNYATDYRNIEYNNLNMYTQKPIDATGIILLEQFVKSVFGSTIGAGPSFYGILPGMDRQENEQIKKDLDEIKRQGDFHYTKGAVRPQLFGAFHNFLLHGYFAMIINPNREKTSARLENIDVENIFIEDNLIREMRGVGVRMFMAKSEIKQMMEANKNEIAPGVNIPDKPEEAEKGWSWFADDYPVPVLYNEFPYYKKMDDDSGGYECKMMCAYYIIDTSYTVKEPFVAQSKDKMESRIIFGTQNECMGNPYGYGVIRENMDTMLKINRMVSTVYETFDKYHEKPLIIDAKSKLTDNSLRYTGKGSVHSLESAGELGLGGSIAEKPGINEPFNGYAVIQQEWQKMRMRLNAIETLLSNIKTAQSTATMAEISYRDSIEKLEYTTQLLEDVLIRPVLKKFYHYLMAANYIDTIGEVVDNNGKEETKALGVNDFEFSIYGTQRRLTQVKDLKAIVGAMELAFSTAGALDPDTLKRKINTEVLIDKIWDLSGADVSILRDKDEMEEILAAENKAMQDAQMAQQAQSQAIPSQVQQPNPSDNINNLLPVPTA